LSFSYAAGGLDMSQRLMQWTLVLLLFSPAMVAQQPGSGHTTPSISDDNAPNNKPNHHQMSTKDVAEKLQKDLDNKNAAYAGSKIQAVVDDQSITLNGTVISQSQHEMAMQLAKAYAGDRRIIDHLVIQQ
jgi:osmotically-inducible protein OsmY